MKKAIVLLAVLALIFATVAPSEAWRGHGHGHWRGGGWGWWWPGAIIGGLALGAVAAATAPFVYAPPVYAAPPVVYQPPPAVYQAPPAVYQAPPAAYQAPSPAIYRQAQAPAPPLVNREVVYPHGRHVLHGDGVTSAWQWVWVPAATQ